MLHIGIVACSTEGAALCYRTISLEGAQLLGVHDHPEVSLHSHSLARYMKSIEAGDWAGVAELMLSSADKLAKAGADFLICPDNTIHQAFDLIEHRAPRPWLHIAREVAAEAKRREFRRLAVLGTRYLMEGPVYPQALRSLKDEGCDAVVLGCTEIPLLVTPESSPMPTLDSTRLLARAAVRKAIDG
ncbi:MAG: aspartate racemase [Acidobacteria bacterium 13_1_20CM_4_56_7]|nr:MAG: aspartate racemase [Acidobacteria bacterium 13_1_20CM_4_56_7]